MAKIYYIVIVSKSGLNMAISDMLLEFIIITMNSLMFKDDF